MAMTEYKTRTGTETVAEGELKAIFFNELKTKKDYGTNGKSWIPTHSVNIIIDEDRVSLGLTDKDVLRAKDAEGNYHDLVKGQKISVVITPNGEYKGVKQWQGRTGDVIVLEQAPEGSAQATGGSQKPYTPQKRDNSGVVSGNGFNAAKALLGSYEDTEEFVKVAIALVDIGQKLRSSLKESRPDLDEYSVGAQSGMALIAACEWAESIDDVENIAMDILDNTLPKITEYVKTLDEPKTAVKKTTAKKTTAKKTVKKTTELSPENVDDSEIPESAFEDDGDLPF